MPPAARAPGLGRLPYRVRQFVLAATAPVAAAEVAAALQQAGLPAPAARLFRAMPRPYQRHALNVAARLVQQGHGADRHLLQAALLHDLGKWDPATGRRVGIFYRVAATLLRRSGAGRGLLRRLAAGPPGPHSRRFPWYLQAAHPALGAGHVAAAGGHPDVVALVRWHEDPDGGPARLRPALRLLAHADDQE